MDRKLKLKIGQKVVIKIEEMSNAARYLKAKEITLDNINIWIFNGEVIKIGRKYITVKFDKWKEELFSIENNYKQKYTYGSANYKLYLNKEEIIEEIKAENIYNELQRYFGGYGRNNNKFSLNQLERIKEIVDENQELD